MNAWLSFSLNSNHFRLRQCVSWKIPLFRVPRKLTLMELRLSGNLTEINCTSKTRKLRGNLTEILMEILTEMLHGNGTGNKYEISGITGNYKKKQIFRSKLQNFFIYTMSVIYTTSRI